MQKKGNLEVTLIAYDVGSPYFDAGIPKKGLKIVNREFLFYKWATLSSITCLFREQDFFRIVSNFDNILFYGHAQSVQLIYILISTLIWLLLVLSLGWVRKMS